MSATFSSDLSQLIKETVTECLQEYFDHKLLNRQEAAEMLGVSVSHLDYLRQSGQLSYVELPPNRNAKTPRILYERGAVRELVRSRRRRIQTADEFVRNLDAKERMG